MNGMRVRPTAAGDPSEAPTGASWCAPPGNKRCLGRRAEQVQADATLTGEHTQTLVTVL